MMMTKEVWDILLNTQPPHKGFEFQPIDRGDKIVLRLFADNFATFSVPQQQDLEQWITLSIVMKIRELGVPCYLEFKPTKERVEN